MAARPASVDFSDVVLDLDDVSCIGHPCWEFLDPNPDIQQLTKRFNKLFFRGILHNSINLKWMYLNNKCAGETRQPQNSADDKIHIYLNVKLMKDRLRKEIVEQLLVGLFTLRFLFEHLKCVVVT